MFNLSDKMILLIKGFLIGMLFEYIFRVFYPLPPDTDLTLPIILIILTVLTIPFYIKNK